MAENGVEGHDGHLLPKALLFASIRFYVVQSHALQQGDAEKLSEILLENGAVQVPRLPGNGKIPVEEITHIISTTSDFQEYEAAVAALKAVVKPDWVRASITKARLANSRQYSPDPRLFFSGVIVCCADLPSGDEEAIYGGVLAMGGLHSYPVSKLVTHIVALTTEPEKCQTALNRDLKCKLVLPHWFDDCLKLGKRIDEAPYMLPNPEILRVKPEDSKPEAARPDLRGALSIQPGRLPTPTSSPSQSRRELTVFLNKKVMLSNDLELGSHLRGTLEDLITNGGGNVTGSVHKADIYVCQYREGSDYRIASRAGKDVGNLSWLYYLITHNGWTSPLRRLLHYPIARQGLPGFKNFRISLSNYNGEARVYLENLAKAAGCDFTKTMKEDNTHLITAHMVSEKCDAAKEWNINMINHLWLEESYAKWQIQTLANPRYTHFPPRTNLGEVVGQTQIDKLAIERFFFPKGADVDMQLDDIHLLKSMRLKDQSLSSSTALNSSAAQPSSSAGDQGAVPHRPSLSERPTPKASKESRRQNEGSGIRTPVPSRHLKEGKENETPSTTGSRSAKERAVAKLHDLAPDIALFEKETKRVGGVVFGGRKTSEEKVSDTNKKRSVSKDEDSDIEDEGETRGVKRARKAKAPPPSMRLLLSGYQRWVGLPKKEDDERAKLREMGILITQQPTNCTHLASPHIVRTQKFICALAHAPVILSTDFVDQCLAMNKRLPAEEFPLNDTEGENRLGFKIADALKRAETNKGRLLHGYSIYCTENIHGGFDTYKSIIEINGGKCLLYRARAGSNTSSRAGGVDADEGSEPDTPEYVYLISGITREEGKVWPKFRQMVHGTGLVPRIVKTDWMLDLALSQKVVWADTYALTDKDAVSDT